MEPIANFTRGLSNGKHITPLEHAQLRCDWYNATPGPDDYQYINCDKCKNKGYIATLNSEGVEVLNECECMAKRKSYKMLEASGLGNLIKRYTFKSFETHTDWQKDLKAKAQRFVNDSSDCWFFIGGQSGSGKSHICTAICSCLIAKGHFVKYKIWRELFHTLQSSQFDDTGYKAKMDDICNIDVLYVDDFLKSNSNSAKFADELNFAFEIINRRYNANKKTIISSELLLADIASFDTALAGRIAEKAADFVIQIKKDDTKNYRLR